MELSSPHSVVKTLPLEDEKMPLYVIAALLMIPAATLLQTRATLAAVRK